MKRWLIAFLCVSILMSVSACSDRNAVQEPQDTQNVETEDNVRFTYSQDFADTVVSFYFGREYDKRFTNALLDVDTLSVSSASKTVYIDERAGETISAMLYTVLAKARDLESSASVVSGDETPPPDASDVPSYGDSLLADEIVAWTTLFNDSWQNPLEEHELKRMEEIGFIFIQEGDNPYANIVRDELGNAVIRPPEVDSVRIEMGNDATDVLSDNSISDEDIMRIFFPTGSAPDMKLVEGVGRPSSSFKAWFVNISKSSGLLDSRLYEESSGVWAVDAVSCAPEYGGTSFRVFERTFIIPDESVGNLASVVRDNPLYSVVMDYYMYFDKGYFRAVYKTDPSLGLDDSVTVTVSFRFFDPGVGSYEDDFERFTAGVRGVSVNLL